MTDLPPGWKWATLDDVAAWGSGGTPRKGSEDYYGGEIPWAVIGDLNDNIVNSTQGSITERGLQASSAKLVPQGAILIAMYGASIGKLGIANRELSTNQAIAHAIPNCSAIERRYLFWYLRSQRPELLKSGKGAAQRNISQTVLRSWPIPVPPLAEQHRIVAILDNYLSRIDTACEILTSTSARIAAHRDRFITAACTGDFSPTKSSAPPPEFAGVQDGKLPSLPGSWKWIRLGEIADVTGGITKDAKKQIDSGLTEVPYLRVANVQRGRLDLDRVAVIRAPINRIRQLRLQEGDVLLNEGGDRDKLGRGWIWEGQLPECIHQNHVFRARIRDSLLEPKLLAWHSNTFGKAWCERNGKQSVNLASISLSKIRLLPVPVPPQSEQLALVALIEDHLDKLDRIEGALRRILLRSENLGRSLLIEAYGGRLVPQDANDEPASVPFGTNQCGAGDAAEHQKYSKHWGEPQ